MSDSIVSLLIPLLSNILNDKDILSQWNETNQIILADGAETEFTFSPPAGKTYIIWKITYSQLRNNSTNALIENNMNFSFVHSQGDTNALLPHTHFAVQSSLEEPEFLWLEVTKTNPMVIKFTNNVGNAVDLAFTLWVFEAKVGQIDRLKNYIKNMAGRI